MLLFLCSESPPPAPPPNLLLSRSPLCTSIFGLVLVNLNLFTEDTVLTDNEMALSHIHALVGLFIVL